MTVTWLAGHEFGAATNTPVFQVTRAAGRVSAHVLRLVGELDLASAPLLTAAGLVLAGEGELISGLAVRVDLSELSFLDSSGLTALNDVAVQLTQAGATASPDPSYPAGPAAAHPRLGRRLARPRRRLRAAYHPSRPCLRRQSLTQAQIGTDADHHRRGMPEPARPSHAQRRRRLRRVPRLAAWSPELDRTGGPGP